MKKFIVVVISALIPSLASAEGFYVSALYGSTSLDTGVDTVVGATLDEDDTGYAFVIGNEIDENMSIEGFYIDFGEASLKGDSGDTFVLDGTTYVFNASATVKATGTSMGVAGKLHFDMVEKLGGFVKFGMHSWDTEETLAVATASATSTDDGIDILMGIGAEYDVSEKVAFVVGYDKYTLDDDDVTFLNGGIKVRF
ncbi:porin family protein [Alphaproteobacteria bacterium]|nr:porin family protein [Alphaproteobacteria bacterium]